MKILLSIALVIFAAKASGQKLKKVEQDSPLSQSLKETFTVLKSNKDIRQGNYVLGGRYVKYILQTGYYKNNLKDSIWTDYDYKDSVIGKGAYKEGKRAGIWEYYKNGQLENKYDFTNSQLIFHAPNESELMKRFMVIRGAGDTLITKLEREPIYAGGTQQLNTVLMTRVRYPAIAREHFIQGRVVIAFTVDEKGEAKNHYVAESLGYGCDEEVMRVVKQLNEGWFPAVLNGKPVTAIFRLVFSFAMVPDSK